VSSLRRVIGRWPLLSFLIIAYAWSWLWWFPAAIGSARLGHPLPTPFAYGYQWGQDFRTWDESLSWRWLIGTLGPGLAFLVMRLTSAARRSGEAKQSDRKRPAMGLGGALLIGGLLYLAMFLSARLLFGRRLLRPLDLSPSRISQLLVYSWAIGGLVEVGWWFYVLPLLAQNRPWRASLQLGLLWGLWQLPLFVTSYLAGGPWVISVMVMGWLIQSVALSAIHLELYLWTRSPLAVVFLRSFCLLLMVGIRAAAQWRVPFDPHELVAVVLVATGLALVARLRRRADPLRQRVG